MSRGRNHPRHVAGPCRGGRPGRIRTRGLVAHPRTVDLGDARVGLLGLGGLGLRKRKRADEIGLTVTRPVTAIASGTIATWASRYSISAIVSRASRARA